MPRHRRTPKLAPISLEIRESYDPNVHLGRRAEGEEGAARPAELARWQGARAPHWRGPDDRVRVFATERGYAEGGMISESFHAAPARAAPSQVPHVRIAHVLYSIRPSQPSSTPSNYVI